MQAKDYLKNQNFNFITKTLHKWRYKLAFDFILREMEQIQCEETRLHIIDFGCGTAGFFNFLRKKNLNCGKFNYLGIEVSEEFIDYSNEQYSQDARYSISRTINLKELNLESDWDKYIFVSLETFEHLPYTLRIDLVKNLGERSQLPFLITVPNEVGFGLLVKNIGSLIMGYTARFNEYGWRGTYYGMFERLDMLPAHTTYHRGFDWRALQYELRQFCKFRTIKRKALGLSLVSLAFVRQRKLVDLKE